MKEFLRYPFESVKIMKNKRSIRRLLLNSQEKFIEKKIALLGGSTTSEIKSVLELFLLDAGIKPFFYESEYNRYYEDSLFENQKLDDFQPDFIYIHTGIENIQELPNITDTKEDIERKIENEYERFFAVWENLRKKHTAIIIQDNFVLPYQKHIGNIDCIDIHGYSSFILKLNQKFANCAIENKNIQIHDVHYLAARIGLDSWYDRNFWYAYKFSLSYVAIPQLAFSVANLIKVNLGKSKKCLILDLDNTLWGGVIADEGVNGIKIGKETPLAEAYTEFQQYVLLLKKRGVILAACSKNDEENAKAGFSHPDSILKVEDFVSFKANWQEKHLNIMEIAKEINIGLDSMVFIDDNPMERQIVRENLQMVTVPEIDSDDVSSYVRIIDQAGYFDLIGISEDDLYRNQSYASNIQRNEVKKQFVSYEEFLKSLDMTAEISSFQPIYLERIAQLTNKTNQFNLTTKRYTYSEIEEISKDNNYITLCGRLKDKFGDNGLVSIIIGKKEHNVLHIHLWLMSCRVLKRGMENAMFSMLIKKIKEEKLTEIIGYYYKTQKNAMVDSLYQKLGFELIGKNNEDTIWKLRIEKNYICKNEFINIIKGEE